MELNKLTKQKAKAYFESRATKIMGVIIALFLIGINVYIGLFMATLVTNTKNIQISEGVSLPIIRKHEYDRAKTDIVRRQSKQLQYIPEEVDPFKT